jgi:RNA polymerase-binding transcription factor DksA
MVINRKKISAKPAPRARAMSLTSSGKGKSGSPKPGEKPAAKTVDKPGVKSAAKPDPRIPVAKAPTVKTPPAKTPGAKGPAAKTPGKAAKVAPVLNKGALAAKAMAEARAAARAEAEAKRPRRLVPATPNAIRPGASKQAPAKGKALPRPPAEVRPLGVLPPEAMAKSRPAPGPVPTRAATPMRPAAGPGPATSGLPGRPGMPVRPTAPARVGPKGDERLNDTDLQHFEKRLLEERARITREMGHIESTILKVNPRDSAGEVGGYSFHMADAGTDSMEREISFDIASKEGRLLREIDDALRRIYNGVYGICEASGNPIARARLEALPWARYTIEEQANMERQQRAGRLLKEEE